MTNNVNLIVEFRGDLGMFKTIKTDKSLRLCQKEK